jgi:hypothetical protein
MMRINSYGKLEDIRISTCYTLITPISNALLEKLMPPIDKTTTKEQTTNFPNTEEVKDGNSKYNLSKFEYDLYHEEDNKAEKVIRVKRVSMPNKGQKWKIFEDGKVMFVVEGTKLNKKEQDFLCTIDGVNFLIAQYKEGIKSFNALKLEIKKKLKAAED